MPLKKRHLPAVIFKDEPGTPHMRIITRCLECDVTITDRPIDVSKVGLVRAGDLGCAFGEEDGDAWLSHVGLKKRAQDPKPDSQFKKGRDYEDMP